MAFWIDLGLTLLLGYLLYCLGFWRGRIIELCEWAAEMRSKGITGCDIPSHGGGLKSMFIGPFQRRKRWEDVPWRGEMDERLH